MDILEAITRRVSVRRYLPEPVSPSDLENVRLSAVAAEALTEAELQFHICPEQQISQSMGFIFGIGNIRAPHYLIITAKEVNSYLVDCGYRFEQMILEATRGLGTCWIGGNFKESAIRSALGLDQSRRVVAITPIGKTGGFKPFW